jgi:hypothetical protein
MNMHGQMMNLPMTLDALGTRGLTPTATSKATRTHDTRRQRPH